MAVSRMESCVRVFCVVSRWMPLPRGTRTFGSCQRCPWSVSFHSAIGSRIASRGYVHRPLLSPVHLTPFALSRRSTSTEKSLERLSSSYQTPSLNSLSRPSEPLNESFPSVDGPLKSQPWRQFLTSDEKTIVCVHPVKPVELKDTQPLRPLKPWVMQQRTSLNEEEMRLIEKLRAEDGSLWTVNTLARFFNVKRAVIKKVAPTSLERQKQLKEEEEWMSKLKPYKRKLIRTKRQMERQKRLEAVIAQNKDLSNLREKYHRQP